MALPLPADAPWLEVELDMNHSKILARAWTIVWQYRALWVFGFLFALAGGGGGLNLYNGGGNGGGGNGGRGTNPGGPGQFPTFTTPHIDWNTVALIAGGVLAVVLVLIAVMLIIRYMSETALMAGADEIESTGAALSVRRGFRLGWSRQAWRLFLTDLVIHLPLFLGAILLVVAAATPLLLWVTRLVPLGILGTVAAVGLEVLVILVLIVVNLVLSVVMPYLRRRVVLARQGPLAALRQSARLVRASLLDTGLMWLLLAAIRIVWSLVMIPIVLVLLALALVVGGVPAGLAYLVSHTWVWPVVVGVPLFLLIIIPTTAFVGGLFETYVSTSWTLSYREVTSKFGDQLAAQAA
jgi:hypothetical protein